MLINHMKNVKCVCINVDRVLEYNENTDHVYKNVNHYFEKMLIMISKTCLN